MPDPSTPPERPELTFPDEVADWVRRHYEAASVILEYGSGGSTALAAELPGRTVFSVESDAAFAARLRAYLDAAPVARATVHMHHVDVGETGRWGRPTRLGGWKNYWQYPLTVWERADFRQPDLVLVDGIFRTACALATMLMTERPVTLLFDDFLTLEDGKETVRPRHAGVLEFLDPVDSRGRMARFEVTPRSVRGAEFRGAVEKFFRRF
jgi:hypothetical protein